MPDDPTVAELTVDATPVVYPLITFRNAPVFWSVVVPVATSAIASVCEA
jgi:hypothetical protein